MRAGGMKRAPFPLRLSEDGQSGPASVSDPSATMTTMKNLSITLLLGAFAAVAAAQEFPTEPYDFLVAKMAASEGRFDDAISRIDRVIEKNPDNAVLLYERAMFYIDS